MAINAELGKDVIAGDVMARSRRQVLLKHSDSGNLSHDFREILSIILIHEDYSEVAKENKVPANAVRPLS
jgi:hypothetical protein